MAREIWYRICYRYPDWKCKIGWPDGFARSHWQSSKDNIEKQIEATKQAGGEAFIEEQRLTAR